MSLLSYQDPHVQALQYAFLNGRTVIDASDTGTGKTFTSCYLAKEEGFKPIIICPKAVLMTWKKTLDLFEVEYLGIANYELMKGGSWFAYDPNRTGDLGEKEKCPYLEVTKTKGRRPSYKWIGISSDVVFIFDEAHRCKNKNTVNSKLLLATHETTGKKMLLSATIADKPHFFAVFSVMLGFCQEVDEFKLFIKRLKYMGDITSLGDYIRKCDTATPVMLQLHKMVFPNHGSRMKISELGDAFPKNRIIADTYVMDDDTTKAIQEAYQYISIVSKEAAAREALAICKLAEIIRARQKIEALKVKAIVELTRDAVDDGNSVVIFVNYLDTMSLLVHELGVKCLVKGGQTIPERQKMIDDFQEDKEHIIICQIQSGGVGISLHDTNGARPRISIISPSWSAQDMMQTFGRIHRAGGKSMCIQKIVYCHGTVEDRICQIVNDKLINYMHLNDGEPKSPKPAPKQTPALDP